MKHKISDGLSVLSTKIQMPSISDLRIAIASVILCAFAASHSIQAQQYPGTQPVEQNCSANQLDPTACSAQDLNSSDMSGQTDSRKRLDQNGLGNTNAGQGRLTSDTPGVRPTYNDTEKLDQSNSDLTRSPRRLPPEPPTEFQKFVFSSTGQSLPVFGMKLFEDVPSTFAPLDLAPIPADFVIGPGDELRIRVWGQVNLESNLKVDRSGEIYLPSVGPIHVAGLPFDQLEGHLRTAIGRIYRNFSLTADMGRTRAIQVYVTGQARRPGVYTISSLSTLLDALFAGGGCSVQGSLRHIQLRREGKLLSELDVYDVLTKGDKTGDVKLQSGDVVFIPAVGTQVALSGSIRNPGIYELREGETVSQLLGFAGGVTAVASQAQVQIEHISDRKDRRAERVSIDQAGLKTPLGNGDLVHVFPMSPAYRDTVTLRGNTANSGRFAWHPGMHVSELIPDKESLLTRGYWWHRARLGMPGPEFLSADELQSQNRAGSAMNRQDRDPDNSMQTQGSQNNPSGRYERSEPLPQGRDSASQSPEDGRTPSSTGRRASGGSTLGAQQHNSNNWPWGSIRKTEVNIAVPEIDWNYAVVERLNRDSLKTELIPFDLGKVVQDHDSAQDIELQAGDVVTVFSEADIRLPIAQQSKLIKLEGEFAHPGTYSAQPGESLRALVQRAGGVSLNAYLYGSEFDRESVRAVQQSRIDEYVDSLEVQVRRSDLEMKSSAVSSAQDLAAGTAARSTEDQMIERLRQVRATGRMVLEFTPSSIQVAEIPEILLENGDVFVVPSRPANVNVIGAVYNQNSFLFKSERRSEEYLRLAGGPTRSADFSHSFIIRADGEVLSRKRGGSLWRDSFLSTRLFPGDTIVVPEKTFKVSALRGVLDWTQVFSQLALGAAAIRVLR